MNCFLDKNDFDFYSIDILGIERCDIFTDQGTYIGQVEENLRNKITHIKRVDKITEPYNYYVFPLLKYFDYNDNIENIDFDKFTNLDILLLNFNNMKNVKFNNLPNIKILILRGITWFNLKSFFDKDEKNIFYNLPVTTENIIFESMGDNTKNEHRVINFIKEKISSSKLPFNCKISFIDGDDRVFCLN